MRAYTQAQNPELTDLMNKAETTDEPVDNLAMSVEARAASVQLYYILVMVCKESMLTRVVNSGQGEGLKAWRTLVRFHEPTTATRHASLLMEVLNFDMSGEAQERLAAFDRAVTKYEDSAKTTIPTTLKVGIILKQIPESALRQHLILNLERWNHYEQLRQEIENIARAQVASNASSMPMDWGALGNSQDTKGNKGKGKGRGKGEPRAQLRPCYVCGKKGHMAKDCWQRESKGKGKPKGNGKGNGKGRGKGDTQGGDGAKGKCWRCGQKGHQSINAVAEGAPEQAGAQESISGFRTGRLSIAVDSGAAASVIPAEAVETYPTTHDDKYGRSYESATGERTADQGLVCVACQCQGKQKVLRMRKTRVKRGLLAVRDLLETGHRVIFEMDRAGADRSYIEHIGSGERLNLMCRQRVWELEVKILDPKTAQELMPLNHLPEQHPGRQVYP
eukprot:6469680-Amphidinium_carterae.1